MLDFGEKANVGGLNDARTSTTAGALEQNSRNDELKNAVTSSGQTLTLYSVQNDTDTEQLAKALGIYARGAQFFQDNGTTANAVLLTPKNTVLTFADDYDLLDNAHFYFVPAYTNTGATTVNIGSTTSTYLGVKSLFDINGDELDAGALTTDSYYDIIYDSTADSGAGAFLLVDSRERAATYTIKGKSRFATTAESVAGTATEISVDPAGLAAALATVSTGSHVATSSTAAATAAKVATSSTADFSLVTGGVVFVTFDNANTVASALTLNVDSTGDIGIVDEGGNTIDSTNPAYFPSGVKIEFYYDGTYFVYKNRVVESYYTAASWYRLWSSGWKKQGGYVSSAASYTTTISFLLSFLDTNYIVASQREYLSSTASEWNPVLYEKTTSSMTIEMRGNTSSTQTMNFTWQAEGF